jgi:GTP diphosphokinase / guanosine-3',5'-bis(diphosphate) 3'-diphosphatase
MSDLAELWLSAWRFAAHAHRGQTISGGDLPYIVHVGQVANEVLLGHQLAPFELPGLALQCALLHDTLEDTEVHENQLVARFGPTVTAGVRALTKNPTLPKSEAMGDSLRRIRELPREIWAVKLADRIANLGDPPRHWLPEKIHEYRHEAQRILAQLGEAHGPLAARLEQKIAAYPPATAASA